jgi:hypothetical protein
VDAATATIEYALYGRAGRTRATKMVFSPYRLFRYDDSPDELACLKTVAQRLESKSGHIALAGPDVMIEYMLKHAPELKQKVRCVLRAPHEAQKAGDLAVAAIDDLLTNVATVFICETRTHPRQSIARRIRSAADVEDWSILERLDWRSIPRRAFIQDTASIYPLNIPEIRIRPGLDMVLMDLPSRNLSLMPNGLGYVHKALKKTSLHFQTIDCDIILYHRFHCHRLLDVGGPVMSPRGTPFPDDPWSAEDMSLWDGDEMVAYFESDINEIVNALLAAKPAMLGLSIQQCNLRFAREVVQRVRKRLPNLIVIVGGYSCRHADVGRRIFPECDYMAIGEADESLVELVEQLKAGKRPRNIEGILGADDDPVKPFRPARAPQDMDALGMPDYDWFPLDVYRNYHHYQLTPVIASRGCHWGKCRFCGEALPWRTRSPENFVDEIEHMVEQGCYQFVFSESDLNGDPALVEEICRQVIARDLPVIFGGQLRIDKRNTPQFFDLLKKAGFVSLRFGVDGWSQRLLKTQNKGYSIDMVRRNLKDCHSAGIYVEVNAVVGCPGETDDDLRDCIDLMLENRKHIGRLANINPLQLLRGSIYWNEPEKYRIHFTEPRERLMERHMYSLPPDVWYSEEPFIDHNVRNERCARILAALQKAEYDFGAGASTKLQKEVAETNAAPSYTNLDDAGSAMIRLAGEYYCLPPHGSPVPPPPGRPGFWQRMSGAIRRPHKYGQYARRIARGGVAGVHLAFAPKRRCDATTIAPRQTLSDDTGQYLITKLSHELPPGLTVMIKEFDSFNILRIRSGFCAIRHGYPLDVDKVAGDGYPPGVCVKGDNIMQVVRGIRQLTLQAV